MCNLYLFNVRITAARLPICSFLLVLSLLLVTSCTPRQHATTSVVPAADGQSKPVVTDAYITRLAEEARDSFNVPGFAVGVIKNGRVVSLRGFGERQLGQGQPVDENTQFAIASNSKAFIGTALAQLAEENRLSLDDKVTKHLPYLKFASRPVTELANVTDLLSHRVGLGTFEGDHLWFRRDVSPREVLEQVDQLPLVFPFRAGYGYSNLMFIAAGEVIRAVTGESWEHYVREHFLKPLDMRQTVTNVRALGSNVASGHVTRQENLAIAPVAWDASGAAGGMWSSAADMIHWMQANLDTGRYHGQRLWNADVQRRVWTPTNTFGNNQTFTSYGLGWFMYKSGSRTVITHGGGYDGFYSRVLLVPEENLGIVVLTNSMTGLPGTLANRIRDAYLGRTEQELQDWLPEALAAERRGNERWFARQDSVTLRLSEHRARPNALPDPTGRYTDPAYGTFRIIRQGSDLRLAFPRSTQLAATLIPVGGDYYRINWDDQSAWFDRGLAYFTVEETRPVLRFYIPNDDIFYDSVRAVRQ